LQPQKARKAVAFTCRDSMFEHDSAPAHGACEMVEFLAPDFSPHVAYCWHDEHFLSANQIKLTIRAR